MTDFLLSQELRSDPAADSIINIIAGATRYKILEQCLEVGLFDELESLGEASSLEFIAKKCNYDSHILEKLLNTLCSMKLVQKDKNQKGIAVYRNAPGTSKYLTRSKRPTMIGLAMSPSMMILPMLDNLPTLLKSGKSKMDIHKKMNNENNENSIHLSAPNHVSKTSNNQMEKENNAANLQSVNNMPHIQGMPKGAGMPKMSMIPKSMKGPMNMDKNGMGEFQTKFLMAMEGFSASCASEIIQAFDLSSHRTAIDLGGGPGRISFELAKAYPHMKITVLDLPPVVQIAQKIQPASTQDQVEFKAGNFFEDDFPSADLYMLGHILHGWDIAHVDKLLQTVFNKLPPGGSLLVMEKVLSEAKDEPETAVTNNLILSFMSQGVERSRSEYKQLFTKHGFCNIQFKTIEGFNYYDVMLVKKPF